MALRRLNKELEDLKRNPSTQFSVTPVDDNMFEWRAEILGPTDSPFEGGVFVLSIKFPRDYPFRAPRIQFQTKIYHPDICQRTGSICGDLIDQEKWRPSVTVAAALQSICALLVVPVMVEPLEPAVAKVYQTDRCQYERNAREWTKKYATPSQCGNSQDPGEG